MARFRNRLEYLDEYSPGDTSELLGGSRFSRFASLPDNFGDLSGEEPKTYTKLLFDRLSAFEPEEDDKGSNFQRFLALHNNPDYLASKTMKLPVGFNQFYGLMSGFGS